MFLMGAQIMIAPKEIQQMISVDPVIGRNIISNQMDKVLQQLGYPPLALVEKDYWFRCEDWCQQMMKIIKEKGLVKDATPE